MTLILFLFGLAIAAPSFAIGLLLGRWEARGSRPRQPLAPHQALALLSDSFERWSRP